MPIWGAVVLRHEKDLSTTFELQGSTIAGFFENRQAVYLRFCFPVFGMAEAIRVNVVDGPLLWQGGRSAGQGS